MLDVGVRVCSEAQQFGIVEVHSGIVRQLQGRVEVTAGELSLTHGCQEPPENSVKVCVVQVYAPLVRVIEQGGEGRDVSS